MVRLSIKLKQSLDSVDHVN